MKQIGLYGRVFRVNEGVLREKSGELKDFIDLVIEGAEAGSNDPCSVTVRLLHVDVQNLLQALDPSRATPKTPNDKIQ